MKRFFLSILVVASLAVSVSAQQPSAAPSNKPPASTTSDDPGPQLDSPMEPPRSEPRGSMDSSSRDNKVDISPPANDGNHEGSDLVGPDPSPGVVEMKPWNPHRADKDVEVGMYYFKLKNYPAAESRFREALHWQDNHAEATYRLATALEKLGRPSEAKQYYEEYLKILPKGDFANESKKALDRLSAEGTTKAANNKTATSRP